MRRWPILLGSVLLCLPAFFGPAADADAFSVSHRKFARANFLTSHEPLPTRPWQGGATAVTPRESGSPSAEE